MRPSVGRDLEEQTATRVRPILWQPGGASLIQRSSEPLPAPYAGGSQFEEPS